MKNLFNIITFCVFFRGIIGNSSNIQPKNDNELIWSKDQCDNYCFELAKPLLNHFTTLKEQIDTYDKMKEKIIKLEKELESSKIQNKAKDDMLKEKEIQLKARDALTTENQELIKNLAILSTIEDSIALAEKNHQLKKIKLKKEILPDTCTSTSSTGIQRIQINDLQPFEVSCISPSSGWTVIQRRINGSVDFHRDWVDYKMGFGDIRGEFFIGLEKLHLMTQSKPHELYILMRDVKGTTKYARYDNFNVGSEIEKYRLNTVGSYTGTAGDSLSQHVGYMFTTRDQDNDVAYGNCAGSGSGGWWYHQCSYSHLNGIYHEDGISLKLNGIGWGGWKDSNYTISLTFTEMMTRPTL